MYTGVGEGVLVVIKAWSGADFPTWGMTPFLAVLGGGVGVLLQGVLMGMLGPVFAGTTAVAKAQPSLAKARIAIVREHWDEARAELDTQWSMHPGHAEIVREYERLFLAGLKAPSGAVAWLSGALERVQGADRAYVYLRLAEINAERELNRPAEARSWCRRLLREFPGAYEAGSARSLLAMIEAAVPAENSPT